MSLRPQHRTVRRRAIVDRPLALAARDGRCPCGQPVATDEPIVHVGSVIEQGPDGRRRVDLTSSEWRCTRCVPAEVTS